MIISENETYVMDKDDKIVQLFVKLGMPKNLAKTLIYISQVEECQCADIEHGAYLRQPEVSIALRELRERGWVKKSEFNKKGKGRPVHIYKPIKHLSEILKTFEQEKLKEVENVKKYISELKNIFEGS